MFPVTFGDLASQMSNRRTATQANRAIATLSQELTTGRLSEPGKRLGGDYGLLAGIERRISRNQALVAIAKTSATFVSTAQAALERMRGPLVAIASQTRLSAQQATDDKLEVSLQELDAHFRDTVDALNTHLGGRSIFGGEAMAERPVADAEQILDAIRADLGGALTATDAANVVTAWFAAGGGFDAVGYLGGGAGSAFDPAGGGSISLDLTAEHPAFRGLLAALALGTLARDPQFAENPGIQREMMRQSSQQILASNDAVLAVQAQTGLREARIDAMSTRAQSQITTLEISRSALVDADPYETATRLQDAITRLDTIYMLTARISRLSLTEYLR